MMIPYIIPITRSVFGIHKALFLQNKRPLALIPDGFILTENALLHYNNFFIVLLFNMIVTVSNSVINHCFEIHCKPMV
jgi:hypothetical protein